MRKHNGMRPQDVPILLKIEARRQKNTFITSSGTTLHVIGGFTQKDIASELGLSSSEITESLARSVLAGLYNRDRKKVATRALLEFLQHGIRYVFPQQPGALVRGIPTAHSAKPLVDFIQSNEPYVWPSADGIIRGQAVEPLYPTVVQAINNDPILYEMLALVDTIRVGKTREINLAVEELRKRLQPDK